MEFENLSEKEKRWGMLCHLLLFASFIFPTATILGTFSIWLFKRKDSEFINTHIKEVINFQFLCVLVLGITLSFSGTLIGAGPIAGIFVLYSLISAGFAVRKASQGAAYKYIITLRLLK